MLKMTRFDRHARRTAGGFTIIELMMVVTLVAILGSLAVSTYRSYVLRANRTEGRLVLLATQVAQEKFFLQNNRYAQTMAEVIADPAGVPPGLGIGLGAGNTTQGGFYTITLPVGTATTYTIQASATGTQATDDTPCQWLRIDQTGTRTASPDNTGTCWK